MDATNRRRNYLSKRELQFKLIAKLMLLVLASTIISILITSVLYYELSNVPFKGDIPFYYVTEDIPDEGAIPTAFDVLFPGLMVAGVVMLVVTSVMGVLATHRIAGAIFRFQLSSKQVGDGDLSVKIKLRDKDEFHDLASDLTTMIEKIRNRVKIATDNLTLALGLLPEKESEAVQLVQTAADSLGEFQLDAKKAKPKS